MMRGVLSVVFVVAFAGIAAAEESPVQVVDKPAATETVTPKAPKAVKVAKAHKAKHKAKHKARKHKKTRHHAKPAAAPTPE